MALSPWTRNDSFSALGQSCCCHHGSRMTHSGDGAVHVIVTVGPEWFILCHRLRMLYPLVTRNSSFHDASIRCSVSRHAGMAILGIGSVWTQPCPHCRITPAQEPGLSGQVRKHSIRVPLRKDNEFPLFGGNIFPLRSSLGSLWRHLWHANPEYIPRKCYVFKGFWWKWHGRTMNAFASSKTPHSCSFAKRQ